MIGCCPLSFSSDAASVEYPVLVFFCGANCFSVYSNSRNCTGELKLNGRPTTRCNSAARRSPGPVSLPHGHRGHVRDKDRRRPQAFLGRVEDAPLDPGLLEDHGEIGHLPVVDGNGCSPPDVGSSGSSPPMSRKTWPTA